VHAQSVVGDLTTGSAIPEDQAQSPVAPVGQSQTLNFGATVGLGETDNVTDASTDRRSQTLALTGIDFGWIRTGSALNANVVGNFDYLDYLEHAYSSELLGRFDGLTTWSLFSGHLKWNLQDDFGEGQLDPYAPATPTNLEQINVVTTGPDVILRPLADTIVQVGARYARTTYETSPFDGYRLIENVLLEQLLSSSSNVGLGADVEQLRFDNTIVNSDYDRSRFYFRYDITGARTHITATIGEAQSNDGGNWIATPLALFELSHQLSPQTVLAITGGRELTDVSDTFGGLRSGAAGGIAVAATAQTSGDYLRNYVTASLQRTGERTTVGLSANWERDTYAVDSAFDETFGSLQVRLDRQLSSLLSAGVFGMLTQSRYFEQDGQINGRVIGANVTWQASRTLSVQGRYSHVFQSTSAADLGFSANTIFVTLTYRPIGQIKQAGLQQGLQPPQ
jgi:hypothetical protein